MQEFVDSSDLAGDRAALRDRMRRDGYLFLRNVGDRSLAAAAGRLGHEILQRHGWLTPGLPPDLAPVQLPLHTERHKYEHPGYFELATSAAFNCLPYQPGVEAFLCDVAGPEVFVHPYKYPRLVYPDRLVPRYGGNRIHRDHLPGGAQDMFTMWVPLMDIPVSLGGLAVKPGSTTERFHPPRLVDETDPAWATTDYQAGDVLLFHCFTYHASLPNRTHDQLRLSGEFRWQLADVPVNRAVVFGRDGNRGAELFSRLFAGQPWWHPVPDGLTFAPRGLSGIRQPPGPSRFVPLPSRHGAPT